MPGLPGLIRRHWIFSIALGAAVLPRLVAMIGFQPAVLFRLDTYDYLWGAVHVSPNAVNPSGYSLFLWLLRPFHSIVGVVALQHLLGLGIATLVYALVRRYGLPDWGATLAAAPVLFDPAQILAEQFVMADLLAMALMAGAFAVLLLRRPPSMWQVVTAGLMTGASVTVRPTALPLVLLIPLFLLLRPAGLQALCPSAQPGHLAQPDPAQRLQPKWYLWNHRTWQWRHEHSGFVPDTAAFTPANNAQALHFAITAIAAQPFGYIGVVARESAEPFAITNNLRFPTVQPRSAGQS